MKMVEILCAVLSLGVAYLTALVLSRQFFGDAQEGLRMLYHWIVPLEFTGMAGAPEEPERSIAAQLAYVAAIAAVGVLCFTSSIFFAEKLISP